MHIAWQMTLNTKIPGTGWILSRRFRKLLAKTAQELAREAEATASRSTTGGLMPGLPSVGSAG
jgi:hypothetical protein